MLPLCSRSLPVRTFCLASLCCLLVAVAFSFDIVLAEHFRTVSLPGLLDDLIQISEVFGHGIGVAAILVVVMVLDSSRRRCLPRLFWMSLGAGLAADGIKLLVARRRPRSYPPDAPLDMLPLETFEHWFPVTSAGSGLQSFPSAHTATAVGLAVALAWLYQRGRLLFVSFAGLAAMQRLVSGAHFASDITAGAALGYAVALVCLKFRPLASLFDRWERRPAASIQEDLPQRLRQAA